MLLPSEMKLWKGNVFTSVCQEFCPQVTGMSGKPTRADTPQQTTSHSHPPLQTATAVDGMHPTGRHSCHYILTAWGGMHGFSGGVHVFLGDVHVFSGGVHGFYGGAWFFGGAMFVFFGGVCMFFWEGGMCRIG